MAEQVTGALVRGYEVLRREQVAYDYEKVFWRALYGVGLVGMGWLTLKLGRMIYAAQNPEVTEYLTIVDWVEGSNAETPVPNTGFGSVVAFYRSDPEAYAEYVAEFEAENREELTAGKVLSLVDTVYARYGPLMPLGVLTASASMEAVRVRKLRGELDG